MQEASQAPLPADESGSWTSEAGMEAARLRELEMEERKAVREAEERRAAREAEAEERRAEREAKREQEKASGVWNCICISRKGVATGTVGCVVRLACLAI